jgi:hypothetical protein
MIRVYVACDICKQPLEVEDDFVKRGSTKEWDTRDLFHDLCPSCAANIDRALFKMKTGITTQQAVMANNKKLNNERKEKLGTNG